MPEEQEDDTDDFMLETTNNAMRRFSSLNISCET
jgi:hypothetical protein